MSDELDPLNDDEFEILRDDDNKDELFETDSFIQDELGDDFEEIVENDDIDEKEIVTSNTCYDDDNIIESELDVYFRYGTNNHKLDGKHSLKRDIILNGKINEEKSELENDLQLYGLEYETHSSHLDHGSLFIEENTRDSENSENKKKLSEEVYFLLKNNTDLDFSSNRRKPNKATFNNYYKMLLMNINAQYTKSEIFVELSYYFTDNIFNMYKLLDKKYATTIIVELREKGFLTNLSNFNFM
jgi:hypothetical protein